MSRIDQLLAYDLAQQELKKKREEKTMAETKGECGCHVKAILGNVEQIEIVYCPLHKAAPALYEALKAMVNVRPGRFEQAEKALAEAGSKQ